MLSFSLDIWVKWYVCLTMVSGDQISFIKETLNCCVPFVMKVMLCQANQNIYSIGILVLISKETDSEYTLQGTNLKLKGSNCHVYCLKKEYKMCLFKEKFN